MFLYVLLQERNLELMFLRNSDLKPCFYTVYSKSLYKAHVFNSMQWIIQIPIQVIILLYIYFI